MKSFTELATFRRCRLKWKWLYGEEGVEVLPSLGQEIGTLGHKMMSFIFSNWEYILKNDLFERKQIIEDVLKSESTPELVVNTRWTKLLRALQEFVIHGVSHLQNFDIVAVEQRCEREEVVGIIDLIVRNSQGLVIVDHKFLSRETNVFLDVHSQLLLYSALLPETPIYGVLNVFNLSNGTQRWLRVMLPNPEKYFQEVLLQKSEMSSNPVIYRNPTDNCSWDCPFVDRCFSDLMEETHGIED